jgi:hypothetical protein
MADGHGAFTEVYDLDGVRVTAGLDLLVVVVPAMDGSDGARCHLRNPVLV